MGWGCKYLHFFNCSCYLLGYWIWIFICVYPFFTRCSALNMTWISSTLLLFQILTCMTKWWILSLLIVLIHLLISLFQNKELDVRVFYSFLLSIPDQMIDFCLIFRGAMENKSLNVTLTCFIRNHLLVNIIYFNGNPWASTLQIFNSKLVLASPETATDADYAAILGVIGHEVCNHIICC